MMTASYAMRLQEGFSNLVQELQVSQSVSANRITRDKWYTGHQEKTNIEGDQRQ